MHVVHLFHKSLNILTIVISNSLFDNSNRWVISEFFCFLVNCSLTVIFAAVAAAASLCVSHFDSVGVCAQVNTVQLEIVVPVPLLGR